MHTLGICTLLSGMAIAFLAQLYLSLKLFKFDAGKAFAALFIPGYVFLLAKRHGLFSDFLKFYILGLVLLVIGGVILS